MTLSLPPTIWENHRLEWGIRTYVMGIINVTPDSFSGDGLLGDTTVQHAVAQAQKFVMEGATLIDVGGESTRPHATPVSADEEVARVIPVIEALSAALPKEVVISIDTYKAKVAEHALNAGACMINDTWALRHDSAMASIASKYAVPIILMANMRGNNQKHAIVSDIVRFLAASIDKALTAGIAWERIIIDPGIGFGTTPEETLTILNRLGDLRVLERPILLGSSRKSFIGLVLGGVPVSERLEGTAATVALGIAKGADIVRVHDVDKIMPVVKMSDKLIRRVSKT